jgi:hypothetical protein
VKNSYGSSTSPIFVFKVKKFEMIKSAFTKVLALNSIRNNTHLFTLVGLELCIMSKVVKSKTRDLLTRRGCKTGNRIVHQSCLGTTPVLVWQLFLVWTIDP